MNIIFGIWRPKGAPVDRGELTALGGPTRRFAEDSFATRTALHIGMAAQAHYTDDRARLEVQPALDDAGNILAYDGRLDNHADLQRELGCDAEVLADTEIILRAYQRWGRGCFSRLIGDWSIALWDATRRTLYFARDHAGTRTLHYSRDATGTVIWSTYLDSFLVTGHLHEPDSHYMASYLAMLPVYGHTPYRDVQAVVPGHFVAITERGVETHQFWTPLAEDQIVYKSDGDYQSHFLWLLEQSVARRDGPGAPRLAHLSGGRDSTSIVCISDKLRRVNEINPELIDTLSLFDDSESSWNERPYFTLVEAIRGKSGIHMDASQYRYSFDKCFDIGAHFLYPGIDPSGIKQDYDLRAISAHKGHRSILSGIGGDELTGGIPDPATELAEHLARGNFITGTNHAIAWCISNRTSLAESFIRSIRLLTTSMSLSHLDKGWSSIPWLTDRTRQLCHASVRELPLIRYAPFRTSPRAVELCQTWWYTLRTQPHLKPSEVYRYEFRYPFFDRDLDEFLFRVPSDQLARPGRSRFMMRNALKGIVPDQILERRRKAFMLGSVLKHITKQSCRFEELISNSLLAESQLIDKAKLTQALKNTVSGRDLRWWGMIQRAVCLETWLRVTQQRSNQTLLQRDSVAWNATPDAEKVPAL